MTCTHNVDRLLIRYPVVVDVLYSFFLIVSYVHKINERLNLSGFDRKASDAFDPENTKIVFIIVVNNKFNNNKKGGMTTYNNK